MHECYAVQILETTKKKNKYNGHKGYSNEAQGPKRQRQIRDIESHQSLDEVS